MSVSSSRVAGVGVGRGRRGVGDAGGGDHAGGHAARLASSASVGTGVPLSQRLTVVAVGVRPGDRAVSALIEITPLFTFTPVM